MADMEEMSKMVPSFLHLISAFFAMEAPEVLISLSRICGGGSITEEVQRFIWEHCFDKAVDRGHSPYMKAFLKKLIAEVESGGVGVLDELYEQYAYYMTSLKDDNPRQGNFWVLKRISFLFPDVPICPKSRSLVVNLQCSLNMLEGDTGCSIWPSSLLLSEFILSHPEIFSRKSCFEVGSGVGLVGICLAEVKASKVILSDGDLSTLANLKHNLKLNQLNVDTDLERFTPDSNVVQCIHLPWESALDRELHNFYPDIVLGADVIYDPSCLPHLIRVLSALLNHRTPYSHHTGKLSDGPVPRYKCKSSEVQPAAYSWSLEQKTYCSKALERPDACDDGSPGFDPSLDNALSTDVLKSQFECCASFEEPVAYIASVIRNVETFNCFLKLAEQANLVVTDITKDAKPLDLLPYMQTYQQSDVRLFSVMFPFL